MDGLGNTIFVKSPSGQAEPLGPLLASGGEGKIYTMRSFPKLLVKWYHKKYLLERGEELQKKIAYMVARKDDLIPLQDYICWPQMRVTDLENQWIGYAMRRSDGVKMAYLAHAMAFRKYFPDLNRKTIIEYLITLVETVEKLHAKDIFIGDYNLNNILCIPGTNKVTLIDCDSYQLREAGRRYPCHVGSPDMTPKEQHQASFASIVRTTESEVFSMAIILFKCLMLGYHRAIRASPLLHHSSRPLR